MTSDNIIKGKIYAVVPEYRINISTLKLSALNPATFIMRCISNKRKKKKSQTIGLKIPINAFVLKPFRRS